MTRDCTPPHAGAKAGRKPPAAKSGASTAHKAVTRLNHEVRHERPMTDWGAKAASKGGKR